MQQLDEHSIVINRPKEGEFYTIGPDMRGGGRGHGVVFENHDQVVTPSRYYLRPEGGGFPQFNETPRLRHDKREGDMPQDLQGGFGGYWLVSERLKNVFESVDPDGFAFARCDFILHDGSQGPPHYLCDVLKTIDAMDEVASKMRIELDDDFLDGKYYNLAGGVSLTFKKKVIGSSHIFRTPYNSQTVFCDRILRDALIENGFGKEPKTRGVWLEDAANY